ncbi:MAG: NINE protein [Geminocystis sp.]|nr:NINE protein [Geminocystis sp.]HIK36901.1 NINE protein [Geminocystis sp. M7585_C2015_104]MCS7148545.1 NINE protein [Geminocystis sp.]MCX8079501.1 NINE protein [Geminocystis sp.]MDW8114882.1 NINE protein [Geminocystis sp.]
MRNRVIAILLTLFLGALGIHKFYLGENMAGVLYLIFCWTGIPAILSIFDLIGLSLMSDERFNRKYNPHLAENTGFSGKIPTDVVNTLRELKQLYDSGIITAEEYERKRRKYLDSL